MNAQIPDDLKQHDHWVLWAVDDEGKKRLLAPWISETLYPVPWGSDADERPETDWETVKKYHRHRQAYPSPDGIDVSTVKPAPLLLHEPLDPPLMMVDFDDVRDPDSGEITNECLEILDRLDGYTEISQSGEGLHVYVRASLPGNLGKFIGSLHEGGDIELYDHGRTVGATWNRIDDYPMTVPERQETIEEIIKEYETDSQRERRLNTSSEWSESHNDDKSLRQSLNTTSDDADRSPYFDIDIRSVAGTGHFAQHRSETPGDDWTGPHPEHGPQHSEPDECTSFGVEPSDNLWNCWVHKSGGRAIELAAVLCPETDVSCNDLPQSAAGEGWLSDNPRTMLTTCLWIRDQGVVEEGIDIPYAAKIGVAKHHDLDMKDDEKEILGAMTSKVAAQIYQEMTLDDVIDD
jgi:hypothetical protein